MARLARVEFKGAIHHVTVRGNNRRALFKSDGDRVRMIEALAESVEGARVRLYAYCLMSNHVHLLVETPHANLGRFMQKWQTRYTVYYNRKHGESGHVTQGRYGAKPVEGDRYLLNLVRYIHLNPVWIEDVRDLPLMERVTRLREYAWSSYGRYRTGKGCEFVDDGPILELVSTGGEKRRRQELIKYTEAGVAKTDDEFIELYRRSRFGIGRDDFLWEMEDMYRAAGKKRRLEDVAFRREGRWLPTEQIVAITCRALGVVTGEECVRRRESWVRPIVSRMLSRYGGLTQREVAERLGIGTGKPVSIHLKRLNQEMNRSKPLTRRIAVIESLLESAQHASKH